MRKLKNDIIKLRLEGKTYNEIEELLKCSKGTISYHCGEGQKQKSYNRKFNYHPYLKKMYRFCDNVSNERKDKLIKSSFRAKIYEKIRLFCNGGIKIGETKLASNISFTLDDVIKKFGENPKCYLTGAPIDIYKPSTYHFDHIIPISRGGKNTLDNLGICTKVANFAKRDLTSDEFIELCKQVVEHSFKE